MRTSMKTWAAASAVALGLLVFGTSPALAQGVGGAPMSNDERHEGIGIGLKGGFLFSKLNHEAIDFEGRTGRQIGIFFGGNRPGLIGVMAEVNYGQKGGKIEGTQEDYDVNFVSVPVVMRINGGAKSLNGVSFYGIVGPQLDWLISQSLNDVDIEDDTKGFEVSLVAGAGVEITRFIVELRYIHGLKSISERFEVGNATDLKSKAFAILFGIRFN